MAVTVEVAHGDGIASGACGVAVRGLEGAISLTQQEIHCALAACDGEVEMAIAVNVAYRHGYGEYADGVALGALERTVAVAQQDTYRARVEIGKGQIEIAVAVEVPRRQGIAAAGIVLSGPKGAVAVAQ